jgi:hypothetical protein
MRTIISLALLCVFIAPALFAADVPISPAATGPAYGEQRALAAGSNGEGYLVVWEDFRDGGFGRLMASRVTDEGTLLDPFGLDIGPATGLPYTVSVDAEGDGYRVEFETAFGELWRRLVHADGTLDAAVRVEGALFTHPAIVGRPLHATNGSGHFYAGRESAHEASRIVLVRTDAAGAVLGEPVFFPPLAIYRGALVGLLWTGRDYVLLIHNVDTLRAQRISAEGLAGEPFVVSIRPPGFRPLSSASRGDGSFAVLDWQLTGALGLTLVDAGGASTGMALFDGTGGVIASNGDGYLLAWDIDRGIGRAGMVVAALDERLSPRDRLTLNEPRGEATRSAVAQKGLNSDRGSEARLLVWADETGETSRVMARRPEAPPSAAFALWTSPAEQHAPAVARVGETHLVVWYESSPDPFVRAVRGMLVNVFNEPLLTAPVTVGVASFSPFGVNERDIPPAVAWTGRAFLVAWTDNGRLRVSRVSAGGVVLGDVALPADSEGGAWNGRPVLVRAAQVTLLVWQHGELEEACLFTCLGTEASVRTLRLDAEGQPLDAAPRTVSDVALSSRPDAAWNGRALAVTWINNSHLFARELDRSGNAFETVEITDKASSASILGTGSGEGFLIAVEDLQRSLHTFPFLAGGLPGEPFSRPTNDQRRPNLWRSANGIAMSYERLENGVPRIYLTIPQVQETDLP